MSLSAPRRHRAAALMAALSFGAAAAPGAAAFGLQAADPAFVIDVPGLPEVPLQRRAAGTAGDAAPGYAGQAGGLDVTVELTAGREGVSTRECAGRFLRALVARPGMPDAEGLYRAPLGPQTFLVIYLRDDGPVRRLHAHLLAAAAGGRCVEAHFQRPARPDEDDDAWRQSFTGARIE